MHTTNDHAVKVLNSLIETTLDSAYGYKDAAEVSENFITMVLTEAFAARDAELARGGPQPES